MPNIRHTVALSAFEADDQYDNIENKLCAFNAKQKKNSKSLFKCYFKRNEKLRHGKLAVEIFKKLLFFALHVKFAADSSTSWRK